MENDKRDRLIMHRVLNHAPSAPWGFLDYRKYKLILLFKLKFIYLHHWCFKLHKHTVCVCVYIYVVLTLLTTKLSFDDEDIGMSMWQGVHDLYLYNLSQIFNLLQKVESRVRILGDLRELASSESPDSFTLVYTNILEQQPDCPVSFLDSSHHAEIFQKLSFEIIMNLHLS